MVLNSHYASRNVTLLSSAAYISSFRQLKRALRPDKVTFLIMKTFKSAAALVGTLLVVLTLSSCLVPDASAQLYLKRSRPLTSTQHPYGENVIQNMRIARTRTPSLGTLVFVHGGAWMSGTGDLANLPASLASLSKSGWDIVSIDHRLAPETDIDGMVSDVRAAVRYVRTNARQLRVNASTVILAGHSSGAHLAAMAAFGKPGVAEKPDAVILLAAPADLALFAADQSLIYGFAKSAVVNHALGCGYEGPRDSLKCSSDDLRASSPLFVLDKTAPPAYLAYGALDEIVPLSQGRALYEALVQNIGSSNVWFDVAERSGHAVEDANQSYIALFAAMVAKRELPE